MATDESQSPPPYQDTSIDLWKFFEERGAKLKESMFKVVTWIIGFAGAILAFAIKEGFEKGMKSVTNPRLLFGLGLIGFIVLVHAVIVIRDYGRHINRTFARADATRDGESSPKKIWDAGKLGEGQSLPPICKHFLSVVGIFALGFAILVFLGLCVATNVK
jgi:hypothetical protein